MEHVARFRQRETLPGSIGRVWQVSGVTAIPPTMDKATITVEYAEKMSDIHWLAAQHEVGHALIGHDVARLFGGGVEAFDQLSGMNRWWAEVTAWVNGLESENTVLTEEQAHFALDCLNSYRRGLPAQGTPVSEADWNEAVNAIDRFYGGSEDLHLYVPLEPDPTGDAPKNCLPGIPMDIFIGSEGGENEVPEPEQNDEPEADQDADDGDEDDSDQEDDEDEDEDELPDDEVPEPAIPMDQRWVQQDIIDAIIGGKTIGQVADEHGLDPLTVPPLVLAITGGK